LASCSKSEVTRQKNPKSSEIQTGSNNPEDGKKTFRLLTKKATQYHWKADELALTGEQVKVLKQEAISPDTDK